MPESSQDSRQRIIQNNDSYVACAYLLQCIESTLLMKDFIIRSYFRLSSNHDSSMTPTSRKLSIEKLLQDYPRFVVMPSRQLLGFPREDLAWQVKPGLSPEQVCYLDRSISSRLHSSVRNPFQYLSTK